jgi:hypothetical protein
MRSGDYGFFKRGERERFSCCFIMYIKCGLKWRILCMKIISFLSSPQATATPHIGYLLKSIHDNDEEIISWFLFLEG